MQGRKLGICLLVSLLACTGCSLQKNSENSSETTQASNIATTEAVYTTEKLQISTYRLPQMVFKEGDYIPLLNHGELIGSLQVNNTDKLGINDTFNNKALNNNITESFSVNLTIKLDSYTGNEMCTLKPALSLVNAKGKSVGDPCQVSWTGFSTTINYSDDFKESKTVEIGVQPTERLSKGTLLQVSFTSDSDNLKINPVLLSFDSSLSKKPVSVLKTLGDISDITCINGAKYKLNIKDVYYQYHDILDEEGNTSEEGVKFFDFSYVLNYIQGPRNKRACGQFDYYNKDAIKTGLMFGVSSDIENKLLIEDEPNAAELKWSNSDDVQKYISEKFEPLYKKQSRIIRCNRKQDSRSKFVPTYLRFQVQFPDERVARSNKEMLSFNGRHIVYQIPIQKKVLREEPQE